LAMYIRRYLPLVRLVTKVWARLPEKGVLWGDPLMDFETAVRKRRMCREYSDKGLPQDPDDRILDIASRRLCCSMRGLRKY
jgi:hypothetical protein